VCTLFASGTNAVAGTGDTASVVLAAQDRPQSAPVSVTPAFSSYYQTRAPPALL
jgi:hypothetical protein